jgi:hypothetical protein
MKREGWQARRGSITQYRVEIAVWIGEKKAGGSRIAV